MRQYSRFGISLMLFALVFLICMGCSSAATSPTPKVPTPTQTSATTITLVVPTATPQPTPTIPSTPTATPVSIKVSAKQTVNVRQGPGTQFAVVGKLQLNTNVVVLGKNEDGQWLQIALPDAANPGWVSVSVVSVSGATDSLQVIAVVPSPTTTRQSVVATKAPTAKPSSATNLSESEYADATKKIFDEQSGAFKQLGNLLVSAGDNPTLVVDNTWTVKTAYNIAIIKDCSARIRKLKPPLRYATAHAAVVESANHYDKAMDLLVYSIDHLDADKMKQAMDEMALGNTDMERAVALIK